VRHRIVGNERRVLRESRAPRPKHELARERIVVGARLELRRERDLSVRAPTLETNGILVDAGLNAIARLEAGVRAGGRGDGALEGDEEWQ
jgi:hypothetical protein